MMENSDREQNRYGKKTKAPKTSPDKWTVDDAKAFLDSKEGQAAAAKLARAHELVDGAQSEAPPAGDESAPPAMQPGAPMPAGG